MHSQILILRFPKTEVKSPVVCKLAQQFDLTFNILSAAIYPRKEGFVVLELTGTKDSFDRGVKYLKEQGVNVKRAAQEIERDEEKCAHCGACTAVCTTGALEVKRPEMMVEFDKDKCSVCKLCIPTCPVRAMQIITPKENVPLDEN